jgi:hypothetical protein
VTSSVLVGKPVATPSICHLPPDVHSLDAAQEAIEWGEAYGLVLDADQRATLTAALGERADGSWAAAEVADFKGRQAGKNDTVKVRQGAGIDLFGERLIIHTAHEFATANEDFLRLVAVYENYDALRKSVARVRYANGEQGIEFVNGARIKYRARTGGAGRGFSKADVVIYDEAQHLQPEHLGASFPTMLANPNFQAWYCGSGGFEGSRQAWALRRRALLGDGGRFAYTENTAQLVTVVDGRVVLAMPEDLLSEDVLSTHPGYANGRVTHEVMVTMFNALGPELFAREILCVWEPEPGDESGPIDLRLWGMPADSGGLVDEGSRIAGRHCFALDVAHDRSWSAFGVAGRRDDGRIHVEVMRTEKKTGWVVEAARGLYEARRQPIRVQKGSPAASFTDELREAGVEVIEVSVAEHAEAVGRFLDAVENDGLRHLRQPSLFGALKVATLRSSGDASVWARRTSKADISPLVAVTLALGGVVAPVEEVVDTWAFSG